MAVPKVQEDELAMVPSAMHPARQLCLGADVRRPELAAGMGAVGARKLARGHGPVWYRPVSVGLLLIRRRRPIGEPEALRPAGPGGLATLDGTAGAGRIALALTQAGIQCDSMTQVVFPPGVELEALQSLDLGHRFETAVLGSHLVNVPDAPRRTALLALAARHTGDHGALVIEHHPVDWAETAAEAEPTPGSGPGMVEVRRDPPFVSAVSVFDIGGHVVRQPFTARVLSEAELGQAVASLGLRISRRIGATLVEARGGLDMHDLRSRDDESRGFRT
jgi:hypothetical protein